MIDVEKIRKDFPMYVNKIKMQGQSLVFLDNASTTFKPYCVEEAVKEYYEHENSNAFRGDYDLCFEVDKYIQETREDIARFINAEPNEIVFTSGDSMSINLIAYGYGVKWLKKGDEILITEAEHASNVLPWYKVEEMTGCKVNFIPLDDEGKLTVENLKKVISKNTKIVSFAHITNVFAFEADAKELIKVAHEYGSVVVLDGAQSVPHVKTDVKDLDCDFLAFSAHKMCGPTGIGIMYGKFDLLCRMDPLLTGGGMNSRFDTCGKAEYLEPPRRFEAGTMNIEGIYGFKAAIDYLTKIGMDNIEQHEKDLRNYAMSKLEKLDNITIYNKNATGSIITFNINGVFSQDAASYFNSKGIAVRSGLHCAKMLTDKLSISGTIRASFYFYNSFEDIDRFVEACKNGGNFLDAYFA